MRSIAYFVDLPVKVVNRLLMLIRRSRFRRHGRNVVFGHGCDIAFENVEVGSDVYIGPRATFMAAKSSIKIGNKVLFGPNVTIIAGDHRTDVIGKFMYDVHEKLPENDRDVVIEDDVWIGANATILKGVRIGRGSVIGAASVVTRDVPPYTVYVGSPGRSASKSRFSEKEILLHESLLNETHDVSQG
jgi:acetyltransferase-like isoleucine patch superfamily enzyme